MTTIMWEVRAAAGRVDDLVSYLLATTSPAAQIYRSADGEPRVVVIDPTGAGIYVVPPDLVAGPAHSWAFESVRVSG